MPYLRLYSLELPTEVRRQLAEELTAHILVAMPEQRREWTTVHFASYAPDEFSIGGRLLADGQDPDYFLEITAPNFTHDQMAEVIRELTPVLVRVLGLGPREAFKINIKCVSYDPATMAIGGHVLSDFHPEWGAAAS